jgi:adenine phosphoribosyltransferase
MGNEELKVKIRNIPDFPKKGILFRDITTLLKDGDAFEKAVLFLCQPYRKEKIDLVIAVEARGFIFGGALAHELGVGIVPIRKKGKLPAETMSVTYKLEYGEDTLEIHTDAIKPGDRVLIVDDLLATGGTTMATIELVKRLKGEIAGISFLIELADLKGREKLNGYPINSLIKF